VKTNAWNSPAEAGLKPDTTERSLSLQRSSRQPTIAPRVQVVAATFVPGVPAHSWQATACAGSAIGVKGMLVAAKTMALTTMDLFTDPAHIQTARAEFDQKRGANFIYKTKLADRKPPLDYRK
jgi:aminobenzoyl-glutamate utilization protein B